MSAPRPRWRSAPTSRSSRCGIADIKPAAGLALFLKIRHWTDAYGTARGGNLDRLALELQTLSAPPRRGRSAGAGAAVSARRPPPPPPAQPMPRAAARADAAAGAAAASRPMPRTRRNWRAAIGPKADYYLARWRQMDGEEVAINWNWAACLASLFWFGYRKMWLPMIGVLVASVLLSVIGGASPQAARAMFLVSIGITFVTGAFGNHLYRRQVARLVAEAQGPDREAVLERLQGARRRLGAGLVVSLVILGLFVLVALLAGIQARAGRAEPDGRAEPAQQQQQQDPYSTGEPMPASRSTGPPLYDRGAAAA